MKSARTAIIPVAFAGLALFISGCTAADITRGFRAGRGIVNVARSAKGFTWEQELEIGGTVAAKLASAYEVVKDQRAIRYVNMVANTVAAYGRRPDVLSRVMIIKDDVPNAYACPGGYMFVTTGLLKFCRDESELAGVIGHETAHVHLEHTLQGLRKKKTVSSFLEGTADTFSDKSQVAKMYPGFKNIIDEGINGIVNNRHGAKAEKEADEFGTEWATRAGYDPQGLGRLIGRLPTGDKGKWLEGLSVYKNGDTRAENITKNLTKKKLRTSGGVRNAKRYKRELAGVLK
jgi:predicted Zn-dependent protease